MVGYKILNGSFVFNDSIGIVSLVLIFICRVVPNFNVAFTKVSAADTVGVIKISCRTG